MSSAIPCNDVISHHKRFTRWYWLNANGISGKAAYKRQICLLFNETSEFILISPVFQCLEPGTTQSHKY